MCLDLLQDEWEFDFTLAGIFGSMLPVLLDDPNTASPLNDGATNTFNNNLEEFELLARMHSGLNEPDTESED